MLTITPHTKPCHWDGSHSFVCSSLDLVGSQLNSRWNTAMLTQLYSIGSRQVLTLNAMPCYVKLLAHVLVFVCDVMLQKVCNTCSSTSMLCLVTESLYHVLALICYVLLQKKSLMVVLVLIFCVWLQKAFNRCPSFDIVSFNKMSLTWQWWLVSDSVKIKSDFLGLDADIRLSLAIVGFMACIPTQPLTLQITMIHLFTFIVGVVIGM